ncbi:phytoene desaturase family protein [Rhodococcus aetherivorans]
MSTETVDAVVVGAGQNGLTAAAVLADAGWDVLVLEEQHEIGGAVRTAELHPGFRMDLFSAFYPLAAASPAFRALDLASHGLRLRRAPRVYGHAAGPDDEDAAVVYPDVTETAAELERRHPGDGTTWIRLVEQWKGIREPFLSTLFEPFPPVRGPAGLIRRLGTADALRFMRMLALPARRMAQELFGGEHARLLLLGNAMHADTPVDSAGSGIMGYVLTMLAQDVGYPVPEGGAGELAAALARRGERSGARILCGRKVTGIEVGGGVATEVRTEQGERFRVRRAVLADVSAPALFGSLLPADVVPAAVRDDLRRFEWDTPVVKVNYAFDRPIPWRSPALATAGTVHLGADADGLVHWSADLATGRVPEHPFIIFGQMTTTDPARSPEGTESAWAYTHLPRGVADDASAEELARRVDAELEAHAPGVLSSVVHRSVQRPRDLEAANANLVGGAVNGGTAQIHQQLVFRPLPGFGGPRTPVEGVYLAGSSTHPGGGVHGMCGWNAARAALRDHGMGGRVRRRLNGAISDVLMRS